jgi:hypothetical protein
LWQSGKASGILAIGRIQSELADVSMSNEDWSFRVSTGFLMRKYISKLPIKDTIKAGRVIGSTM